MRYYIVPPAMSPLSRLAASILAILALAAAFFFGLIVLVVLAGVVFLSGLVFGLRAWWLNRVGGRTSPAAPGKVHTGQVIDAEYKVISRRRN